MSFEEQIKEELQSLTTEQQVAFAWRCAVRALPFIANENGFSFWENHIRPKHIFAVFNALDLANIVTAYVYTTANVNTYVTAKAKVEAVTFKSQIVKNIKVSSSIKSAYENLVGETVEAAKTIYVAKAASAAAAAVQAAKAAKMASTTETAAAAALTAAYASDVNLTKIYGVKTNAPYVSYLKLKKVIKKDLHAIKSSKKPEISLEFYGEQWTYFQNALKEEGYNYWANWYQRLFKNNFVFDLEEVLIRINAPEEVKERGAAAVGVYMEELLARGAKRLDEARIIILGDKGAGKTCLARRLINPQAPMTKPQESTAGVDTLNWELEDNSMNVRIWDFAGHTITHAVHKFFLSERCLYILVYDGRSEKRNQLEYWLNHMKNYGGDSEAIILVNERDQHKVKISINRLKEKYPIIKLYSFNLATDYDELKNFRLDIADYIKTNPSWEKQVIPTSYYEVKEELEKRFIEEGQEHIRKEEFEVIANQYEVLNSEELLKNLNNLGISLWYSELKEKYKTLILNPEWISYSVYKTINWVSNQETYSIQLEQFLEIFKKELDRYPKEKHPFLFDLIKHYELAYETKNSKRLIIPHLLDEDQPLPEQIPDFKASESLMMRYEAEQPLPPDTISRFIVRHHQQIKQDGKEYLVWRYGVILEDGAGSIALVREVDRRIEVSVKGEDKTAFISTLRATLNQIFDSYKSKHPELRYRIFPQEQGQLGSTDLWLPEQKVSNLYNLNKPYFDDTRNLDIPMGSIVHIYNITASSGSSVMFGGQGNQFIQQNFNFYDCSIDVQGNLNDLARKLTKEGHTEDAEELTEAVDLLNEVNETTSKEEVKRKGIAQKLRRIVEDLGDDKSSLGKAVKGIRNGVKIAQDIGKGYNKIAQWVGLPVVPDLLLGGDGKEEKE